MTTADEIQALRRKFRDLERKFDKMLAILDPSQKEEWVKLPQLRTLTGLTTGQIEYRRKTLMDKIPNLIKIEPGKRLQYNLTEFKKTA